MVTTKIQVESITWSHLLDDGRLAWRKSFDQNWLGSGRRPFRVI